MTAIDVQSNRTYLTGPQVRARYGITEMTLWRWLRTDDLDFPQPIYVNRRRYFAEADLTAWERRQATRQATRAA